MQFKKQTIYQVLIIATLIIFTQSLALPTNLIAKLPNHQITQSPPKGFVSLFNRKDLTGWKGLVGDPVNRSMMSPEEMAIEQAKADSIMQSHWKVVDGILTFDGDGFHHICTAKNYGDFEMLVDWKIKEKGDSGIYLRGCPQVQIWDTAKGPEGSGGLTTKRIPASQPNVRISRLVNGTRFVSA